ncbi:MAG: 16S rRNA (cytosine(1402)-N(4))-methyltransferase RsmH [Polymorphobacter sp.]
MTAMQLAEARHVPVLLAEVMSALALRHGDTYVDGTFGAGGYTQAALAAGARAYAIDRDPQAIADGATLVARYPDRLTLIGSRFADMEASLGAFGVVAVDAVAFDIGVSSMQIDQAERGFSFMNDGPLDMRMSGDGPSAADFLNFADETEIADVIFQLGEEPQARRIARAIVADRPFSRTSELARLVRSVCGYKAGGQGKSGKDPATRTFQAIRIHINDELGELETGLRAAERLLRPGGRLAVVSFHSLEDRAVKGFLRARSGSEPGGSRHLPQPAAQAPAPTFEAPAKPVRASDAEAARNPRARSATLRSATRTAAPAWRT